MHKLIENHLPAIAELCRRYHVQRLEIFGSVARGTDFDPERSDADFLVEFATDADVRPLHAFFDLKASLVQLLGRSVDLVEISAIRNPYILAAIERSREVAYGA